MVQLFARLWIKDYKNISSPTVQQAYAKLYSALGIVINIQLFLLKLLCGTISGSAAIVADGFNNLADVATTVLSFFGFIMAGIGAGKHHPFGHGRYEWLMSMFSSIAVMLMGFTLAGNSISSIRTPEEVHFNYLICFILLCSIPTLAFQLATSIAISFTNTAAREYGDAAIAAMGIVTRIISMGIYAVSGFAKGFMPIAGYNYGAKQYHRVQEATKTGLIWTSTFCVLTTILMLIFATPVISLFTADDLEVIEIGTFALRANIVMFAGVGVEAIYSMLSLALGKAAGGAGY